MRKNLFLLALSYFLLGSNPVLAAPNTCAVPSEKSNPNIEKTAQAKPKQESQDYKKLTQLVNLYDEYTNNHNEAALRKLYAADYINADGIDLENLMNLINETWSNFPDIKFTSAIKSIDINHNYATVETFDIAKGSTAEMSKLTRDMGDLISNSKVIIYLKKFGNDWKIVSDKIVYEKTFLKYGKAKELEIDFSAPQQAYAGSKYTASVYTEMPKGIVALGSIQNEPIVFPEAKSKEIFRQIPSDYGVLERVIRANTTNNNELAVASVGYTELVQDIYQNPQIKLTGMVLMMQRVNVIPRSTYTQPLVSQMDQVSATK